VGDDEELLVETDAAPPKPEQLATAKAELDREHLQRMQAIVLRRPDEHPRLLGRQAMSDLVPSPDVHRSSDGGPAHQSGLRARFRHLSTP
jgi:hypothetical protein